MTTTADPLPGRLPVPPEAAAAPAVRSLLQSHDLPGALHALVGDRPGPHRRAVLTLALPATSVGTLLAWFCLQLPVTREQAVLDLGRDGVDLLQATGLVRAEEDLLVATARVSTLDGLLLLGDRTDAGQDPLFVAAVSGTTALVAQLLPRVPARRGLDLCTGSGALALLLARHVDHVVATDLSPRALRWAAFNAALNGQELDLREGSLFEPVAGERFDAICANPPFVIGPGDGLTYRDAGLPGDVLSEQVVRGLAVALEPGGRAVTSLSWTGHGADRPLGWSAGVRSARLLRTARRTPLAHAVAWVRDDLPDDRQARELVRWRTAVDELGVDQVNEGVLLLAATAGRRVRRLDDLGGLPSAWCGDRVEASLQAADSLGADEQVVLRRAPGAALLRSTDDVGVRLRRWSGLLHDLVLEGPLADAVLRTDGRRTVAATVTAAALAAGADPWEPTGRDALREALFELVDGGALEPVPDGATPERAPSVLPPAPVTDPDTAVVVRRLLAESGYDAASLAGRLGTGGGQLAHPKDLPVYERRLGHDGLDALIRLLLLGLPVAEGTVPELLVRCGLALPTGGALQATAQVVPHGGLLLASDLLRWRDHPDFVPGVQRPTRTLTHLTPRATVGRALDLGTGCGFQALLLARHAGQVVATDVSDRAVAFARFNAALAGVTLDLRVGAWLEPVAGEHFDLVVANPPYVVSPGPEQVFRDAGLPRDRASELVCSQVPDVLTVGGTAVLLVSWIVTPGPPPPLGWSAGRDCDALLLATAEQDGWASAAAWNRDLRDDPLSYGAALDRWGAWLQDEQIAGLAYGALVLRRRLAGATARRMGLDGAPDGPAGDQISRLLSARQQLADRAVTELVLGPADGVELLVAGRSDGPGRAQLRQVDGLGLWVDLDADELAVVRRCDGSRPLRRCCADAGVEPARVEQTLQQVVSSGLLHVITAGV